MNRKLVEVAMPLTEIDDASTYDKMPSVGGPKQMHQWWARLPLPVGRAMILASLLNDPSEDPAFENKSKTEQDAERERLFAIIRRLMREKPHENEAAFREAKAEILKHTNGKPPILLEPFAGGGSIPLEGQRLGLAVQAQDLNPVAVLLNRAWLVMPARFARQKPVHPGRPDRPEKWAGSWRNAQGMADDIRWYGNWVRDKAYDRIGHLYPAIEAGSKRPLTYLWARTITCPNPACAGTMPLVRNFALSTKAGKEACVVPEIKGKRIEFTVSIGKREVIDGTVKRSGARCLFCQTHVPLAYVRGEGRQKRIGFQLMAIVVGTDAGKTYLPPDSKQNSMPLEARPVGAPETDLPEQALSFRVQAYGMTQHKDLFSGRQLAALTTLSDCVKEVHSRILADAQAAGLQMGTSFEDGGTEARAYADCLVTYLALAIDRLADYNCTLSRWKPSGQQQMQLFGRQSIPMVWDFAESNVFADEGITYANQVHYVARALEQVLIGEVAPAIVKQESATDTHLEGHKALISTDPPYYDNIGYADLSDFFYVWLRRTLSGVHTHLFRTVMTPKKEELIATPFRFDGSREAAKEHFESGFREAFGKLREQLDPRFPMTLYYAFQQEEAEDSDPEEDAEPGVDLTTGWETFLDSIIKNGFQILATWPVRASQKWRLVSVGTNSLASYVVLVCRPRSKDAPLTTSQEFRAALNRDLPEALRKLMQGNIPPADLPQASMGLGIAIFTRYARVIEANGREMNVRKAMELIDEVRAKVQEDEIAELDAETRWAVTWFDQMGMATGLFGDAESLSKAKSVSVKNLDSLGVVEAGSSKVRLRRRDEIPADWDPSKEQRHVVWKITQFLIEKLQTKGEAETAAVVAKLGGLAESAKELAYYMFRKCQAKGMAQEAIGYNALVTAWSEISRIASNSARKTGLEAFT